MPRHHYHITEEPCEDTTSSTEVRHVDISRRKGNRKRQKVELHQQESTLSIQPPCDASHPVPIIHSTTSSNIDHMDHQSDSVDASDYAGEAAYDITPMPSSEGPELWNGLLPQDIDADEYDHVQSSHGDVDNAAAAAAQFNEADAPPDTTFIHVMGKKVPVKRQRVSYLHSQTSITRD